MKSWPKKRWLAIIYVLIGLAGLSYLAQMVGLIPDARPWMLAVGVPASILWTVVQARDLI